MRYNTNLIIQLRKLIENEPIEKEVISKSIEQNNWFTEANILDSISSICNHMLNEEKLNNWLSKYPYKNISDKKIGIIMAGNIPLVGFVDILTSVVLGAKTYYKPSSKDKVLMQWIVGKLNKLGAAIHTLSPDTEIDILIATGSNNAKRYFEDSYPKAKKLIRGSRVSVATIDNNTSDEELNSLWNDCFQYFGLGCRNVSHLFINNDFDINRLVGIWSKHKISHDDYIGSYVQQKAVLTMQGEQITDCGYYLLRKSDSFFTPIGTITYSYFDTKKMVEEVIKLNQDNIQCVVCKNNIPFGMAQNPELWDYADNINTIKFIQK